MNIVLIVAMALSSLFGLVIFTIIVFILADWARRAYRFKHPARADGHQPAPGPSPVPGKVPPRQTAQHHPALRAPAPGLYGCCTMAVFFYDTGITITHDRTRGTWDVDLPPLHDDDIDDFLTGEAAP